MRTTLTLGALTPTSVPTRQLFDTLRRTMSRNKLTIILNPLELCACNTKIVRLSTTPYFTLHVALSRLMAITMALLGTRVSTTRETVRTVFRTKFFEMVWFAYILASPSGIPSRDETPQHTPNALDRMPRAL